MNIKWRNNILEDILEPVGEIIYEILDTIFEFEEE